MEMSDAVIVLFPMYSYCNETKETQAVPNLGLILAQPEIYLRMDTTY